MFQPKDHPLTGECLHEPGARDKYLGRARLGRKYYTGVDSAGNSKKGDATVLITLEVDNQQANLVSYERLSKTEMFGEGGLCERIKRRLIQFPGQLCYDSTTYSGLLIKQSLEKELPEELFLSCTGIAFNRKPGRAKRNYKEIALSYLVQLFEQNLINLPHTANDDLRQLRTELKSYRLPDDKLSTDTVMALALAALAIRRDRGIDPDFSNVVELMPGSNFETVANAEFFNVF